jgi:hypothetical protein
VLAARLPFITSTRVDNLPIQLVIDLKGNAMEDRQSKVGEQTTLNANGTAAAMTDPASSARSAGSIDQIAGVEPFARAGILSLFFLAFAAALRVALNAHSKARIIRVLAGLRSTMPPADGIARTARSTTSPTAAGLRAFIVIAVVTGGAVAGLRWWHQRHHSTTAVGIAFLAAIGGAFGFANDLWSVRAPGTLISTQLLISEALKRDTVRASLLGLCGSVAAVALLGMGVVIGESRRSIAKSIDTDQV